MRMHYYVNTMDCLEAVDLCVQKLFYKAIIPIAK